MKPAGSGEKRKLKRVDILLIILLVLLVYCAIGGYRFTRDTNEFKERVNNGEFDDYHNQPNNAFGAPVVYYKSDLERIVGVDLRESKAEFLGYSCTRYWNNRNIPTKYDDLRFFVFEKEKDARKAFGELKNSNTFREITDEGDNYVRGWLNGVIDADIEMYYYRNGNLIVSATVTSVDESARDIDDPSPGVIGGGQEAQRLIDLIRENF